MFLLDFFPTVAHTFLDRMGVKGTQQIALTSSLPEDPVA